MSPSFLHLTVSFVVSHTIKSPAKLVTLHSALALDDKTSHVIISEGLKPHDITKEVS